MVSNFQERIRAAAGNVAKEEGTRAGKEAAKDIDIGAILKEAVAEAVAAAEAQASDMKAFECMGAEIAENAGKVAGEIFF